MIRYAQFKDFKEINELGETLHHNFAKLFNLDDMINDDLVKIIVYEIDKKVVGFLIATCLYENVDILSIVVDKECRRKKIASNLIDYLFSEITDEVQVVTLEVAVNNESAINLYKKFGFEIINTRKKYYNGIDAYLMGRRF